MHKIDAALVLVLLSACDDDEPRAAAVADASATDASTQLTCDDLGWAEHGAGGEVTAAFGACTTDADCVTLYEDLDCPAKRSGTTGCGVPVNLAYKDVALAQLRSRHAELCERAPTDCRLLADCDRPTPKCKLNQCALR